jgi:UDP-2,3-diacylglucosamine hydrolase
MAEWFKASVLKTDVPQGTGGSNPSPSASPWKNVMSAALPEHLLIIAGRGTYPLLLARSARAAGVARITVAAMRGMTCRELRSFADDCVVFGVGEAGRMLDWAERIGVRHAVMAGQITPTALFCTRFDAFSRAILRTLTVKNAHTIFGALAEQLTARNITVLPASQFMDAHLPRPGTLTRREPDPREWDDIRFGLDVGMRVCDLDIGQTVVVKDGVILAVEAFEGTNCTIRRAGTLGGAGAVVVKVAKTGHDMRFDIPVIGANTIPVLRKARVSALALQAGRTLLLDRDAVIRAADRLNIAVVAVDSGLPALQKK